MPEDLGAQVPDLKDALLGLLERPAGHGRADLKLMTHGPLVATFVFPVVTLPIIGGALGTASKPGPGQARVPAGDCSGR